MAWDGIDDLPPDARLANALSAAGWAGTVDRAPEMAPLDPTWCVGCIKSGGDLSWEHLAGAPASQADTGLCVLFADTAQIETQYLINNCERFAGTPLPSWCPDRPGDDDSNFDPSWVVIERDVSGTVVRASMKLSEQFQVSCSGVGYDQGGTAIWQYMTDRGENRWSEFRDWRSHPYALTGWGYWQLLARVGTVFDNMLPFHMHFTRFGTHDYAGAYGALALSAFSEPDPFFGTCPLVHRFGAGDPDGPAGPLPPPPPFPDDGCEIAQLAARAGRPPVLFVVPLEAHKRITPDQLIPVLEAGYVVADAIGWPCAPFADCAGHIVAITGYLDGGRKLIVRDSAGGYVWEGDVGVGGLGVGGLHILFRGDDTAYDFDPTPLTAPTAPSIYALRTDCGRTPPDGHPRLVEWLNDDPDTDGIINKYDVCFLSGNARLAVGDGTSLAPVFDDGDAWPDERFAIGDGEWGDPTRRSGCDSCPGVTTADRATGVMVIEPDGDPWSWVCDGCPWQTQTRSEFDSLVPNDANDPDNDWVVGPALGCVPGDTCEFAAGDPRSYQGRDARAYEDPDGDGLGVACDPCTDWGPAREYRLDFRCVDPAADDDLDGITNRCDNCCKEQNREQLDGDLDDIGLPDGIGNVCEPCRGISDSSLAALDPDWRRRMDPDEDRLADWCGPDVPVADNCPRVPNWDQADSDHDGWGDACDPCPDDPRFGGGTLADSDGDGLPDVCDLCPYGHDETSPRSPDEDRDVDGWGDACDNCLGDPNPGQQNCDWRWEIQHYSSTGFALAGDACDVEVCTGVPLVADDIRRDPAAPPESDDTYLTMPFPAVPDPNPSFRTTDFLGRMFAETTAGERMEVSIPTTGARSWRACIPGGPCGPWNYEPETLPVGVRRCVCWDWHSAAPARDIEHCRSRLFGYDICPDDGRRNWKVPERPECTPEYACDRNDANDYTGWLGAKLGGGLNYPSAEWGALEMDGAWRGHEEFLPQDPVHTSPPLVPSQYLTRGGTWFDRRVGYSAGRRYPGWRTTWYWQDEVLPADMEAHGHTGPSPFVLWTRPEIVAGVTRTTAGGLAEREWPLVARTGARCLLDPSDPGYVDCDDYVNAYSPVFVEPEVTTGILDHSERPSSPGSRYSPFGDFGDPPAAAGVATLGKVLLAVVRIVNPGDPPDLKFANYEPSAITHGLAVNWVQLGSGYADHRGYPSRMAAGEPAIDVSEFSMAFASASRLGHVGDETGGDAAAPQSDRYYLFGGTAPDGTVSNRMWAADTPPEGSSTWEWRRAGAAGKQPPGLVGAALLVHLRPKADLPPPPYQWDHVENDVLVIGGFDAAGGLQQNLWRHDTEADAWSSHGPPHGQRYAGAWPGVTWRGDVGYLYGGWDGAAPLDGLWGLDMEIGYLVRLDTADGGGPGPRAQPAITVTGDGAALVLYGGVAPAGWTNDLWRFDLRRRVWEQVLPACTVGQCPATGPAGLVVESGSGRVMVVPMEADAQNESHWLSDASGWISADELVGSPAAQDCDGNGTPDDRVDWACRTSGEWWAPVGRKECDSATGAPACDAELPGAIRETRSVRGFHDPRFALGPNAVLYILHGRHVVPIEVSNPAHPRRRPPVRLGASGREVAVRGATLFAATDRGLEAFDLSDPESPARLWSWPIAGGVDDLASWGDRLALAEPDGFRVLDVSDPARPSETAAHRLIRIIPGAWVVDPSGCERDLVRWLLPGRRVVQYDGRTLVFGDRFDMIALDLGRDGVVERVYSPTVLFGRVREMKLHEGFVYTDTIGGFGFVVRVGDGDLSYQGIHALDGWADNAVFTPTAAYRSTPWALQIAHVP